MKAQITKIDEPRASRNGDVMFVRVYFKLQDGNFCTTDLVKSYRNYAYWKDALTKGVGTWVDGLILKWNGKADADSRVNITTAPSQSNQAVLW